MFRDLEAWAGATGALDGGDIVAVDQQPYNGEATVRALPGLGIGSWTFANLRVNRSRELRDGCDDLLMVIATSGDRLVSHRGREQTLGADDAVLMTTAETATKTYPSLSRLISLRVPRKDSEIGWPAAFQGATFPRVDRSILGDVRSNRGDEHVETRRQQGHRWSLVH
ncbi:MAG: hypothetical protein E6G70_21880 [Alphaproteobacteria bacterium]|nr:MAG: hypothetical protein E6G70_21880 [Alphaproteobacteria bacterium]